MENGVATYLHIKVRFPQGTDIYLNSGTVVKYKCGYKGNFLGKNIKTQS